MTTRIIMCLEKTPIIFAYTRAQAIADGVLVDLTATAEWMEAGFTYPVACTHTVWEKYIEWNAEDNQRQTYQDQTGRLWDVLYMLRVAIRRSAGGDQLLFTLHVVPRDARGRSAKRVELKAVCGPGDQAEPVITIMLPNED
jgi:hypothetical protein